MAYIANRPGTVTTAAIILFIVGGWSLLSVPCASVFIGVLAAMPEPPAAADGKAQVGDPAASMRFIVKEVPSYYPVIFASMAVTMVFGIGQIVAGLGLLRLSPRSRGMAILFTIGKLLWAFAGHAYNVFLVMPVQERFFQQNPHIPGGSLTGGLTYITLGITAVIQIAIGMVIIGLVLSPSAKAAFNSTSAPGDDDLPRRRDEGYGDDYNPPPRDTGITDRPPPPPETGISDRS